MGEDIFDCRFDTVGRGDGGFEIGYEGFDLGVVKDDGVRLVADKAAREVVVFSEGGEHFRGDIVWFKLHAESLGDSAVDRIPAYAFVGGDVKRLTYGFWVAHKTCVSLGEIVKVGDVIADGSSTDLGELALGQNLRVAFMPWNGYNFEDSILVSERVANEDRLTTIHIIEQTCTARDTKLGAEDITADIPNVGEAALSKLDKSGIVCIGAEVKGGDILVGKVTPKGETQLTPEEKLLRAIFGEKAAEVKDTSLRVPAGTHATVVDVQVFTREGLEKDERAKQIEENMIAKTKKDLNARATKTARNITKNTTMIIPEHNIPAFKPAKVFFEAVKEG